MVVFTCNVCGCLNQVDQFDFEAATCSCGSNVRVRALVHLLSMELFGRRINLVQFPRIPSIRGVGMSDKHCYAEILAAKFNYTNTFYDRPPRLNVSEHNPELPGVCDFVTSADVLEHIAPPIGEAIREISRLLKPTGFLVATVPCTHDNGMREHFPELFQYRVISLGDSLVLVNRRRDGTVEVMGDLVFHGGPGSTLEMRQFSVDQLRADLLASGFQDVGFLADDQPAEGVLLDESVSRAVVARRAPFSLDRAAQLELTDAWLLAERVSEKAAKDAATLNAQMQMAGRSRWLRLGRLIGVGPGW